MPVKTNLERLNNLIEKKKKQIENLKKQQKEFEKKKNEKKIKICIDILRKNSKSFDENIFKEVAFILEKYFEELKEKSN